MSSPSLAPRAAVRRQPRQVQQAGQRRRRPPVLRRPVLLWRRRLQQRLPDGQHLRRVGLRALFGGSEVEEGRDGECYLQGREDVIFDSTDNIDIRRHMGGRRNQQLHAHDREHSSAIQVISSVT